MKRSDVLVIGLLAAAMSASTPAAAQDRYPLRPVRLVIPSVPAGVHDVIGRVWAERVKPQFGAIVIDNRGGGAALALPNPVVAILQIVSFCVKVLFFCWLQIMIRWTLPRFRYDQLMRLGWIGLLPLGFLNAVVTAVVILAWGQH